MILRPGSGRNFAKIAKAHGCRSFNSWGEFFDKLPQASQNINDNMPLIARNVKGQHFGPGTIQLFQQLFNLHAPSKTVIDIEEFLEGAKYVYEFSDKLIFSKEFHAFARDTTEDKQPTEDMLMLKEMLDDGVYERYLNQFAAVEEPMNYELTGVNRMRLVKANFYEGKYLESDPDDVKNEVLELLVDVDIDFQFLEENTKEVITNRTVGSAMFRSIVTDPEDLRWRRVF